MHLKFRKTDILQNSYQINWRIVNVKINEKISNLYNKPKEDT